MAASQQLPPKEAGLFKQIVRHYETKSYKKGIKAADTILKKFPDHGETLAMRGLTINCIGRKEEAYELVRRGLKNDLRSHVCWHVYGLLYRSDRNYREAIKCYLNALRQDPDNLNILRDLSMLQVQMRDIKGFVETRQKLLALRTNSRVNWITLAIAQHLNGNHRTSVKVLDAYHGTLDVSGPHGSPHFNNDLERYEHSELLLYKAMVLEEGGLHQEALDHLLKVEPLALDLVGLKEQRGRLLLALKRNAEAEVLYRSLVDYQPESHNYHEGLWKSMGLPTSMRPDANGGAAAACTAEQIERITALYASLRDAHPKCNAVQRIPLDFLPVGPQFRQRLLAYARRRLSRGIPSLFSDLRALYVHAAKAEAAETLFLEIEASLKKTERFPDAGPDDSREPPSTLMWTFYYLAQHFDSMGDTARALGYIDTAIAHTPTVIDSYLIKSKILKHGGDVMGAAMCADKARSMDLSDRYLNTICVKRLLRAGLQKQAENTIMLFTRGTGPDDNKHKTAEELSLATQRALYDMQASWYESECGACHEKHGELGMALKKFVAITQHYEDMTEDQFDFHAYSVRKTTLRAYIHMLRVEDRLHGEKAYRVGAAGAIRVYAKLHDAKHGGTVVNTLVRPHARAAESASARAAEGGDGDGGPIDPDDPSLTPAERKRLKQKLQKQKAKAAKRAEEEAAEAAKAAKDDKSSGGGGGGAAAKDEDPDGEKLAATEDPIGEAAKIVAMLLEHAPSHIETHLLAFDVYMRMGKVLLALQAVKAALKLDAGDANAHRNACALFVACERLFASWDAEPADDKAAAARLAQRGIVREVYGKERDEMLGAGDWMERLVEYNARFLDAHGSRGLPQRCAAGEVMHRLGTAGDWGSKADPAKALGLMTSDTRHATLAECSAALTTLRSLLGTSAAPCDSFRQTCAAQFPYAACFGGAKVLGRLAACDGGAAGALASEEAA